MSKTVRVYDPATKKINTIPAAELAPGMVEAQVEDVGLVWINSAQVKGGREYKHPPFEPEVRELIEREIRKPLAEVWPKTLAQWEDVFRRDTNPEQEIGVWCRIANRFVEFSKSEGLNQAQRQECFAIMLHCSTVPPEQVLEVVTLKAMTREQARRAIEAYLMVRSLFHHQPARHHRFANVLAQPRDRAIGLPRSQRRRRRRARSLTTAESLLCRNGRRLIRTNCYIVRGKAK